MFRRRLPFAVAVALAAGLAASVAVAFPEPSRTPVSWELKFESAAPKRIVVEAPGGPKAYWYVTYTVTNNTDADRQFLPSFEWVTNEGTVVTSDKGVPPSVFEAVKAKAGNKLLETASKSAAPSARAKTRLKTASRSGKSPTPASAISPFSSAA